MARQPGSANFSGTIEALAGGPLDARSIVKTKADLTAVGSFEYPYIGMETYVVSENKKYRLIGDNPLVVANWEEIDVFDTELDTTSENGVQNKVIAEALEGKADLVGGKVPASQLPSFVDDVVDGYYKEADGKFYADAEYQTEIVGEAGKIYISVDTEIQYRWTGSAFSPLGGALTLGETSSTAYRGDRGKIAYDDSQTNKSHIGTLSNLLTTAKNNLVAAINELFNGKQDVLSAGDGIVIENDEISVDEMPAEDMDEVIDELPTGGNIAVTGYVPLGTLISFYGQTAPKFFLACDGSVYNKADYPELANHLLSLTNNTPYIVDGDDTKFKVPDLRGEFIRGTGTNGHNGEGSGANVGVHQAGTVVPYIATYWDGNGGNINMPKAATSGSNSDATSGSTVGVAFANVTAGAGTRAEGVKVRPTNTSVLYCIAYKDIYSNPMNDYSTEEKVVGTWIDGKPLYQKTIQLGTLPNNTTIDYPYNILDVKSFLYIECVAVHKTTNVTILLNDVTSDRTNASRVVAFQNNIKLSTTNDLSSYDGYATIRYTKTTD